MNRLMVKNGIVYKYPISDYIRVSAIAFVVLATVVAIKIIGYITRLRGIGGLVKDRKRSFSI